MPGLAGFSFAEAAAFERVMFARGADVVDDQIVVRNEMAFVGMIPEISDILDELSVMADEDIIKGDDPLLRISGRRVALEQGKAVLVLVALDPSRLP